MIFREIENYLENLPNEESKLFIAGFVDAEATFTDRVVIYNKNTKLLRVIQRKLDLLGIRNSHIYKFGVVHGLQLYRRKDLSKFVRDIPAVKLRLFRPPSG